MLSWYAPGLLIFKEILALASIWGKSNLPASAIPEHGPQDRSFEVNPLISKSKNYKEPALAGLIGGVARAVFGTAALLLTLVFLAAGEPISAQSPETDASSTVRVTDLPEAARETISLIKKGGPYPYSRDGAVFANREGRLPLAARGTYREYTVRTPGRSDRGARRIIAAGSNQFWYTSDHYRSFRRIVE